MKVVISTVAYGRAGGTESVAQALLYGLLQKGYELTVLTETFTGGTAPVLVTNDLGILESADVVIQVGAFSNMDYEVIARRRRNIFRAPILLWAIEPYEPLFLWCVAPNTGIPQDKIMFVYSVEYGKHRLARQGLGFLGMKVRYGVPSTTGSAGFKRKNNIVTSKMFLTVGGFDARKRQHELIKVFKDAGLSDTTLVVTGHRGLENMPQEQDGVRVFMLDDRQEFLNAIFESDLLIMNSDSEGFGLVLLEAMFNKTRWAANKVGATIHSEDLADYGYVYENDEGLKRAFTEYEKLDVMKAYRFAEANHTIDVMVNDAEIALKALLEKSK